MSTETKYMYSDHIAPERTFYNMGYTYHGTLRSWFGNLSHINQLFEILEITIGVIIYINTI